MNNLSPSPNQTKPRRRRDGLIWLILLALLLAIVPIGCVAEVALRLVRPDHDPFKDVGSRSSLNAYAPFPPGISYAAVDPDLPNLQATEIARREQQPRSLPGAVTIVSIAQVGPSLSSIVPPTPTPFTIPTPRPTVTPLPPPTDVAGGRLPSPTPTSLVIMPGVTTTPAPLLTPATTVAPTRTPVDAAQRTATPLALDPSRTPIVVATATITIPPISSPTSVLATPTPSATNQLVLTPTPISAPTLTPTAIAQPTLTPTLLPQPSPMPTETPRPTVTPTETPRPTVTPTETPRPTVTPTETPRPTVTPTETPRPTVTPTETPRPTVTPTEEPLPPIEISINNTTLTEGNSGTRTMRFPVTLSRPATEIVSVAYSTVPASGPNAATPGVDFTVSSGMLTFNPGIQVLFVDVEIIGDRIDELNEIFTVALANPVGAVIARGVGTGTIFDDDGPNISLDPGPSVVEGQSEPGNRLSFTFRLSAPSVKDITVNYQIDSGSAVRGVDFRAPEGPQTLVIPAGQTTASITVNTIPNTIAEPDKTFTVSILSATIAFPVSPQSATGTILNDDFISANLTVSPLSLLEGATGDQTTVTVAVTLSGPAAQGISLRVRTAGGTAVAGTDYTALNQSLTFAPRSLSQSTAILVNGNNRFEPDRSFNVLLEAVGPLPPYLTLDTTQRTVTIRDDDLPVVSVASVAQNEGDSGANNMEFTVRLSRTLDNDFTLSYTTVDGSATVADNDYSLTRGTLTFPAGTDTQIIPVPIGGDLAIEPDESFQLRVSLPDGSLVTATGTILNDDPAQLSVTKSGTRTDVSGSANSVRWTISVSNPPDRASATVSIVDSLDGLPGTVLLDSSSASANFGTTDVNGTTITWNGEILPGATLQLTIDAVVLYSGPCLTITNPSYTITVNGTAYPSRTGDGAVQIGDCTLGGLLALPWRLLPIRMATPTPTMTLTPTATASATPTRTPTTAPSTTPEPAPTRTPTTAPSTTPEPAPTRTPTTAPSATPEPAPSATPEPAPSIDPQPTPEPAPSIDPEPTPEPAPSIDPQPTPEPAPSIDPEPTPEPAPSIDPEPTPEPAPSIDPEPTPEPAPSIDPEPTPEPVPSIDPQATPEPVPSIDPQATPEPVPSIEPEPTPEPAPSIEPEPSDSYPGPAAATFATMGPVGTPIIAYALLTALIVAVMSRRRT